MTGPQPPADDGSGSAASRDSSPADDPTSNATYEFHGEKLDFDPYRFGAPEPTQPTWTPPSLPDADPGSPPLGPGDRWNPGTGAPGTGGPEPRPGDYWQGAGAQRGDVFPPAGYTPPSAPRAGETPVDLGKHTPPPSGGYPPPGVSPTPSAYPPPSGYPTGYPPPGGYSPPSGYPPPGGYGPPGGYPRPPGTGESDRRAGNRIAVVGFALALLACVLFFTSIIALAIAGTGLGLSIAGFVKARRGAPHRTFAVLGIVFSIVAIVAAIGFIVYAVSQYDITCLSNLHGDTSRFAECRK